MSQRNLENNISRDQDWRRSPEINQNNIESGRLDSAVPNDIPSIFNPMFPQRGGGSYPSRFEAPPQEKVLADTDRRARESFDKGYDTGYEDGFNSGINRRIVSSLYRQPTPEPTARELGQKEKLRLLTLLTGIEFPFDEALVLQRSDEAKDPAKPITYVTDVALGLDGIRKFLRMRFDEIGPEFFTLSSTPIVIEDYPQYADLANRAVQKYQEARKSK